jgi:hypothetical protein
LVKFPFWPFFLFHLFDVFLFLFFSFWWKKKKNWFFINEERDREGIFLATVVGEKLRRWGRTSHVGHRALHGDTYSTTTSTRSLVVQSGFVNTTIPGAGHINAPDSHSPKGKKTKKERKRNTSSGKRGIIQEMDRETIRLSNRNCLLFQKSEERRREKNSFTSSVINKFTRKSRKHFLRWGKTKGILSRSSSSSPGRQDSRN